MMASSDVSLLPEGLERTLAARCPTAPFGPSGLLALSCFDLVRGVGPQSWVVACDGRFRVAGLDLRFRSGSPGRARRLERLSMMEMAALEVLRDECWSRVNASHEEAMAALALRCRTGALRLGALEAASVADPLAVRSRLLDLRGFMAERSLPDR